MRKSSIIKLLITAGMLVLILRSTKLDKLLAVLGQISIKEIALISLFYFFGQLISSFKWWILSKKAGVESTYFVALKAYFIGMFINCFGLGTVGGDLARGLLLSQGRPIKTQALATVVADRAHGLATLSLIALCGISLFGSLHLSQVLVRTLIILTSGVCAGWFMLPVIAKFLEQRNIIIPKLKEIVSAFPQKTSVLATVTLISVCFHFSQLLLHKYIAGVLGAELPWAYLFVAVPFVNIVSTLPISWNGVGIRENTYVFFLVPMILTTEQAIALGGLWIVAVTICSAIGGIVALLSEDFDLLKKKA